MPKRSNGVSLSGETMPAKATKIRGQRQRAGNGRDRRAPSGERAIDGVPERAETMVPAAATTRNGSQSRDARKSQSDVAPGGEAASGRVPEMAKAALPLAASLFKTVEEIVELQVQRRFCIKSQSRSDRSCEAYIARYLGFSTKMEPKERKKLFDQAAELRKAVEKGDDESHRGTASNGHALSALVVARPIILLSAQSRKAWDDYRVKTEERMRELARLTPGWGFAQSIKGFSDLGLAVVIGEAGMGTEEKPGLANYATVDKLWKRMGLAVFDGNRQGNPGKGASAEEWTRHGYRPARRAEMWAFFSDTMFRHQWRKANEETGEPARPIGPYGEIYARRRAQTADREWTKGHSHSDARRVMTKALLEDLWKVWRAADMPVPETANQVLRLAEGRSAKGRHPPAGKLAKTPVPEAERPSL